jgi:kumamolisin
VVPLVKTTSHGSGSTGWWTSFLAASEDLGPSRARTADALFDLRATADKPAVRQWDTVHDLRTSWYADGTVAIVTGTPESLGKSLGVRVDAYRSPNGKSFSAATRQPAVPEALTEDVTSIGRISSYASWQNDFVPKGGLTPTGLLGAYGARPLIARGDSGTGETVVVFEVDGYAKDDLAAFASKYHLPSFSQGSGAITVVGGQAGKAEGESTLDLETLREIAPKAHLVYFNLLAGANQQSNPADVLLRAFSKVNAQFPGAIWSLSLGFCEKALTFADLDALNKQVVLAEDKGTSVFAASGDAGGLECVPQGKWGSKPTQEDVGVQVPAALPAVTGVGGTTLSVTPTGAYANETSWFYPVLGLGTGGGMSSAFAQPSWQVGDGLPTPSSSEPREVPDVAADADPVTGNALIEGGHKSQGSGTSLATPIWAGFTALMDGYLRGLKQCPIGSANQDLYSLADHAQTYPPFHTVTTGGNDVYRNGPAYSPTTGLGSPDVWNLARDLAVASRCAS